MDKTRGRLKSPEGTAPGREIPLIGVADVSLRGLGSPEEGEQKTFWSPPYGFTYYLVLSATARRFTKTVRGGPAGSGC